MASPDPLETPLIPCTGWWDEIGYGRQPMQQLGLRIADLAVLKGDESGAPLDIDTKDIAAKFIELCWRQSRPLPIGHESTGLILQQNTGGQAAIVAQIADS